MIIGILKYKPPREIKRCWSGMELDFSGKDSSFWTWSVLFGWVHVAPNPYHDPVNITHIPNFLTPFFFLWLAHRHCTIFHSPLFQKSTVTLHYIAKYMHSWPSMHASSASDSAINDFNYIYIWTKLITALRTWFWWTFFSMVTRTNTKLIILYSLYLLNDHQSIWFLVHSLLGNMPCKYNFMHQITTTRAIVSFKSHKLLLQPCIPCRQHQHLRTQSKPQSAVSRLWTQGSEPYRLDHRSHVGAAEWTLLWSAHFQAHPIYQKI